jgi:hypothetical protein
MAERRNRGRERSTSAQPVEDDSDTDGETETVPKSFLSPKLYASLLIFPGIILYVYILYIALANLLYPCSLAPFLPRNTSATATNSLHAGPDGAETRACGLRNAILINAALLLLFVVQHSLMACSWLKDAWSVMGLSAISRLIYVFTTCCTIQFINHFWQSTPSHSLWDCQGYSLSLFLKAIHSLCWLSIACSLFTIDYLELLGIKQLYYSYNGFGDPIHYKSAEQQYLLHHMRHPIFTAPFILVWAVPVMTYDRLVLAVMLPLYLAWASAISVLDVRYVRSQFLSKWRQLLQFHT